MKRMSNERLVEIEPEIDHLFDYREIADELLQALDSYAHQNNGSKSFLTKMYTLREILEWRDHLSATEHELTQQLHALIEAHQYQR